MIMNEKQKRISEEEKIKIIRHLININLLTENQIKLLKKKGQI